MEAFKEIKYVVLFSRKLNSTSLKKYNDSFSPKNFNQNSRKSKKTVKFFSFFF